MRKIPTLFMRDPENRSRVLPEVTPGCEWVLAGEGTATRKYDGTCVMYDGATWWARREIKAGATPPDYFTPVGFDDVTRKSVGWVPMDKSSFAKWHAEALNNAEAGLHIWTGTYELCGPKVNGNPEGFGRHVLVSHREAERRLYAKPLPGNAADAHRYLRQYFAATAHRGIATEGIEGIVWHHPDGRMVKIKGRDFGVKR